MILRSFLAPDEAKALSENEDKYEDVAGLE